MTASNPAGMSASELLGRLDGALQDPESGECLDCGTPVPTNAKAVIAALPEIVAVVKASERMGFQRTLQRHPEIYLTPGEEELVESLAALTAKLESAQP